MPSITAHQSAQTTKMLLLGDSGSGKSGALASLASEGYNLRILDIDNGLDVLANYLKDPSGPYKPGSSDRVIFETLTDPMRNVGGKLQPAKATVWTRAAALLNHWKTSSEDLGPITSWSPKEVLVIDSLSMLANAALNFILMMNARLGQPAHQSDWYSGQQLIESLLQMLYDESVKCNVIINCHIVYKGEDNSPQRGYPGSLGKALDSKIGRYFNSVLMAKTIGLGTQAKRKILTTSTPIVELKNTAPLRVKAEYDLSTGLAEYFRDIRAGGK